MIGSSIPSTGDMLTVTCSIPVVQNLPAKPQLRWTRRIGDTEEVLVYSNESSGSGENDNMTMSLSLEFEQLLTSDGGLYYCTVSLAVESINSTQSASEQYNLTIASKIFMQHSTIKSLSFFLPLSLSSLSLPLSLSL